MAAKSSILTFYLTLTQEKKVFYRANYVLLFIVNAIGLALTIATVFQCKPVSAVFHFENQTKKVCTNEYISAISTSPYNIATDIALIFIPIPLLTRIRLPFRQRVILVLTFGAGISVIVTDIVRVGFLQTSARVHLEEIHSYHTEDISNEDHSCKLAFTMCSTVNFSFMYRAWKLISQQGILRTPICGLLSK